MEPNKRLGNLYCICPLCLSKDRNLHVLNEAYGNMLVTLDIFSKEKSTRAVCWECLASVKKIARFKSNAMRSQQILGKKNPIVILNSSMSRLNTTQTRVISVNEMEKEIEEAKSSSPYLPSSLPNLPSSLSLPSSSSLPPHPPIPSPPHLLSLPPYLPSSPPYLPSSPPYLPSSPPYLLSSPPYLPSSPPYLPLSPPLPPSSSLPPPPKTDTQTNVISVTADEMGKAIREAKSPYLPSLPSQPPPPLIPSPPIYLPSSSPTPSLPLPLPLSPPIPSLSPHPPSSPVSLPSSSPIPSLPPHLPLSPPISSLPLHPPSSPVYLLSSPPYFPLPTSLPSSSSISTLPPHPPSSPVYLMSSSPYLPSSPPFLPSSPPCLPSSPPYLTSSTSLPSLSSLQIPPHITSPSPIPPSPPYLPSSPPYLPSSPCLPSSPSTPPHSPITSPSSSPVYLPSSPPYIPSSTSLPPSSSLPPLPTYLQQSPFISAKLKQNTPSRETKIAPKPIYILIHKPKRDEKPASNLMGPITLKKPHTKKNILSKAAEWLVANETMVSNTRPKLPNNTNKYILTEVSKPLVVNRKITRNPYARFRSRNNLLKFRNIIRNENDKAKMPSEINSEEVVVISDSETDDSKDISDTPLYLSCDDDSDVNNEEFRYDTEPESDTQLDLISHEELTNSFESLATVEKTNDQNIEEKTVDEDTVTNNFDKCSNEVTCEKLIYSILQQVKKQTSQEVSKRKIVSKITAKLDKNTDENIFNQKNDKITTSKLYSSAKDVTINIRQLNYVTAEDMIQQRNDNKITTHNLSFCSSETVKKHYTNTKITTDILDTTNNNVKKPNSTSELMKEDSIQEQGNAVQENVRLVLCSSEENTSDVHSNIRITTKKHVFSEEHTLNNDITKCDDNNIDRYNLNRESNNTVADIQECVGNDVDSKAIQHNTSNTKLLIQPIDNKISLGQQFHTAADMHIKSIDDDTITIEKPQQCTTTACKDLLHKLTAKPQLIVNKITADLPWEKVFKSLKNNMSPKKTKQKKLSHKRKINIKQDLDILFVLDDIVKDHCYAEHSLMKQYYVRQEISKANKNISRSSKEKRALLAPSNINNEDTEITSDDCLKTSKTSDCENEINYVIDETTNLTPHDIATSNVNMSVSINMTEFFPDSAVCEENMISNKIKVEYEDKENENVRYSDAQCAIEPEEIHIKPEPIDSANELTDTASETNYYFENRELNFEVPIVNSCVLASFSGQNDKSLVSNDFLYLTEKDILKEKDSPKDTQGALEINKPGNILNKNLNVSILHSNLTGDFAEKPTNTLANNSELNDAVNMVSDNVKVDSGYRKNTEGDFLKPIYFTNWVDDTYNHLSQENKKKSHTSMNTELIPIIGKNCGRIRLRRSNMKRKIKRKASQQRKKVKMQNRHNSDKRSYDKSRLLNERNQTENSDIKVSNMQENINDDKSSPQHIAVESEINYSSNKNSDDIKSTTIQEKIIDYEISIHPMIEPGTNYNPIKKRMEKDNPDIKKRNAPENIDDDITLDLIAKSKKYNRQNKNRNKKNSKGPTVQEKINNNKISIHPMEELETNCNSNNKRIKKDCPEIKKINTPEDKDYFKLTLHPMVDSATGHNPIEEIIKKDNPDIQKRDTLENIDDDKLTLAHIAKPKTSFNSNKKRFKKDNTDNKKRNTLENISHKLTLHPIVDSETSYNPIEKIIKKHNQNIKKRNMLENIDDDKVTLDHIAKPKMIFKLNKKRMKKRNPDIKKMNTLENIDDDKVTLDHIAKPKTNFNSNKKRIKKMKKVEDSPKIKKSNTPENIHDKLTIDHITESKTSYNANTKIIKKDNHDIEDAVIQEKKNDILSLDFIVDSKTNKNSHDNKSATVQETVNVDKLLLYPVVKLEKNLKLNQHSKKTINELNIQSDPKDLETKVSDNKLTPTDFIDTNKEITLDELGVISDDEQISDTEDAKITEQLFMDVEEGESSKRTNIKGENLNSKKGSVHKYKYFKVPKKLKNDNVFKDAPHKCFLCMQVFAKKNHLTNHMKFHEPV